MSEYLELLGTFYDEKIKFLSKKENLLSCGGCSTDKVFLENDKEIIFSCGDKDKKDDCGYQIHIKLPEYIDHQKSLKILREKLNEGSNWEVLSKYLDVDKKN
mgnify:FL=1